MSETNNADQKTSGQPAAAPHEAPATWTAGRIDGLMNGKRSSVLKTTWTMT